MRRSPATKTRHYQERKRGLSPEVAKQYQRIKDEEDELLLDALKRTCPQQVDLVMTPEAGVQFIADFTQLAGAARGRNVVDLEEFRELVQRSGIPYGELTMLQHRLMMHDGFAGKKLMFTMSADGDEESTIRICSHALLGSKTQPRLLRSHGIGYRHSVPLDGSSWV
ncbi:hypothetical protein LTS16_026845 [Friedmanniomyces endolithicus]|nr:hypothetical protein LTS16_026845 [Friedmanniomyces endolithicus]